MSNRIIGFNVHSGTRRKLEDMSSEINMETAREGGTPSTLERCLCRGQLGFFFFPVRMELHPESMGSHCLQQESGVALASLRGPFSHLWVALSYKADRIREAFAVFFHFFFFFCNPLVKGPKSSRCFCLEFPPSSSVLALVTVTPWTALWHVASYLEECFSKARCIHLAQTL